MYQLTVTFKNGKVRRWYYRDMENAFHKYCLIAGCPSVQRSVLWKSRILSMWPPRKAETKDELRKLCFNDLHS